MLLGLLDLLEQFVDLTIHIHVITGEHDLALIVDHERGTHGLICFLTDGTYRYILDIFISDDLFSSV